MSIQPWATDSDEDIIRLANIMNKAGIPVYRLPLHTFWDSQPDVAEVDFQADPPTVRRFKHGSGFANDKSAE